MKVNLKTVFVLSAACLASISLLPAQGAPAASYWIEKRTGGVYVPPNRPLTRLADLKARHAGEANWTELIMKDPSTRLSTTFGCGL